MPRKDRGPDQLKSFRPFIPGLRWGSIAVGVMVGAIRGDFASPHMVVWATVLVAHAAWRSFRPLQARFRSTVNA